MALIDTILMSLLWILGAVIVFLLMFVILVVRKHKETIHFKETVKGSFRYHKKKAKFMKDDQGMEWWKTMSRINGKKYFPVPPSDSIILDNKGKKHVEAYLSQNGEIVYSKDPNTDLFQELKIVKQIQPITSNQRALWLNQERKAVEDSGFKWRQNLPLIIGGLFGIIVLIIGGLTISDLYEQQGKLNEMNLEIVKEYKETAKIYQVTQSQIQEINQKLDNIQPVEEIPD